jgi:hypothetical protein
MIPSFLSIYRALGDSQTGSLNRTCNHLLFIVRPLAPLMTDFEQAVSMGNRSRSLSYPPTESIDIFKLSSPTPTRLLKPPFPIPLLPWVIPYAIAYLVHVPNTRTIRLALLPFGLVSATWCLVATDLNAERRTYLHNLICLVSR